MNYTIQYIPVQAGRKSLARPSKSAISVRGSRRCKTADFDLDGTKAREKKNTQYNIALNIENQNNYFIVKTRKK